MRLSKEIGDNINYVRAFTVRYWNRGGFRHCRKEIDCYEILRYSDGSIIELMSLTNNRNYYPIERYSLYIDEQVENIEDFKKPIKYEKVKEY